MGTDFKKKRSNTFLIHDYSSSSMEPFANTKNYIKKKFNTKPDFRLFLNEYVKDKFSFGDGVPSDYRDMGVPASWLIDAPPIIAKKFDFIYSGEIRHRKIEPMLDCFVSGNLKDRSLLILSKDYETLQKKLKANSNIHFAGPVSHEEVRNYLLQARYGINYMPDVEPFNQQTSTKFLEYCACKLPVITTSYPWITEFKNKYGGNYLLTDFRELTWDSIRNFKYSFPNLQEWTWEIQLKRCSLFRQLKISL